MTKTVFAVCMLWVATASADVDAYFSTGVLDAKWGATLDQVQAMHPEGTSWPDGADNGRVVYSVPGDFRVLGLDIPVTMVQFIFSKQNSLKEAFFYFKYSDREAALYGTAQALGQDYSIRDNADARVFLWKRGKTSHAMLEIGSGPQFPWSFLSIGAHEEPRERGTERRR